MTKTERFYTLQFRAANPLRGMNACFWDARRTIHFRETLSASVKADKRRSKAAKAGWKTRRAAA